MHRPTRARGLGPGNGQVLWLKCDLSDPRDAKKAAQEFLAKEERLDILVNNAGMISGPHAIGSDGVSVMAIVNYVSPYVFTQLLLPLLKKTAAEPHSDVRVVNVSSLQHKNVPLSVKFDDITDFNTEYRWQPLAGLKRYAHSKLMFTMWSKTLQEQLNDSAASITVISVPPSAPRPHPRHTSLLTTTLGLLPFFNLLTHHTSLGRTAAVRVLALHGTSMRADDVLQLIFCELTEPSPLTQVSQHFHRFSQDPYVRAHYFLAHYGPVEAMYYALGRGKILTERVLDILLTSGAHMSRYLVQIAIHHYFHTQAHFIKTQWCRNVPLRVFLYFLKIAEETYGEIPRGKGEDDGSTFVAFLKEDRYPPQMKSVTWESVQMLLEKYKDPITPQFPLALAIEPRLLPYAVANGFSMDYKYRDFVFRKMFERPSASSETRPEDISENVRELCKLDSAMFVSRTVAAEVCMEATVNVIGYKALKQLDKSGHLRFELSTLVEDLLKMFLTTRSICNLSTGDTLLHLFEDYPSTDSAVRLVVLVVIFTSADNPNMLTLTAATIRTKLDTLGLMPVTPKDAYNILLNPFVERYTALINFAKEEIGVRGDGSKGMSQVDIDRLFEDAAAKCVEIACKGKLLKKLYQAHPAVKNVITDVVLQKHQINMEDLPSWEEDPEGCYAYTAKLSKDFMRFGVGEVHTTESLSPEIKEAHSDTEKGDISLEDNAMDTGPDHEDAAPQDESISELGDITQESLTTMIRQDEMAPVRSRRRISYSYGLSDSSGKLRYPHDPVHIGRWARALFGSRSSVTAVFMTHAVINDNCSMLHHYLMFGDGTQTNLTLTQSHVPVTLKHFKLLARLGRTPNYYLWYDIERGAEFFIDENDYITNDDASRKQSSRPKIKVEAPASTTISSPPPMPSSPSSSTRGKKRPRRSAAGVVRSYADPDSDDEDIANDTLLASAREEKKQPGQTSLQLWIKHLGLLLKTETRKYNEMKKRLEKNAGPGAPKVRIQRNDFVKSLTSNLRNLRKQEAENRIKFQYDDVAEDYSNEEDDDEYVSRRTKRKTVHAQ
ncbi:hypothetical protein NLJ89_g6256 [Agrocybe chaxingu]|uniref:Uncharacterized protein n=1 Tax=Agrocybe chaxingu TaxID=84603 RepID=A0A9W8JZ04_9AGAR|nr:hypothetical protein NLJ89_g6256 [Agrocybe chaxingu]